MDKKYIVMFTPKGKTYIKVASDVKVMLGDEYTAVLRNGYLVAYKDDGGTPEDLNVFASLFARTKIYGTAIVVKPDLSGMAFEETKEILQITRGEKIT